MSETFITLSQGDGRRERSFGKGSGFLEDFIKSPAEQLQYWRETARKNYQEIRAKRCEKIIVAPETQSQTPHQFERFYQLLYSNIPTQQEAVNTSRVHNIVNSFWSRNITPTRRYSSHSTHNKEIAFPTKVKRTSTSQYARKYSIIKGKTYYFDTNFEETLREFREKQKTATGSRPATQNRNYVLSKESKSHLKSQQVNRSARKLSPSKMNLNAQEPVGRKRLNIGLRAKNIIIKCDDYLKLPKRYAKYDLDNQKIKPLFTITHEWEQQEKSFDFDPIYPLKEKYRNRINFIPIINRCKELLYLGRDQQSDKQNKIILVKAPDHKILIDQL